MPVGAGGKLAGILGERVEDVQRQLELITVPEGERVRQVEIGLRQAPDADRDRPFAISFLPQIIRRIPYREGSDRLHQL